MAEKKTVGDILSEARREKGLSLDEIARETNISRTYLEAFEKNDFSVFPAETYVMGFLRTYADLLELDFATLLYAYRHQIQLDHEIPLEELVGKKKAWHENVPATTWRQILILFGGIVLFAGLVSIFWQIAATSPAHQERAPRNLSHFAQSTLPMIANQKFRIGQEIFITNTPDKIIRLTFEKQNPDRSLVVRINGQRYTLKHREIFALDTDGDRANDFVLEILSANPQAIRIAASIVHADQTLAFRSVLGINSQFMENQIGTETVLHTANQIGNVPIKIQGIDRGFGRIIIDNEEPQVLQIERGFEKELQFNQYIILALGNAGAVKLIINNREESGGGWGEVNKSVIYWRQERNRYKLVRTFLR